MAERVLVIGGGPAGASASIFLAAAGIKAVVVDRKERLHPKIEPEPKIGESLPPDARPLLESLGIWESFQAGPHLPCYGNKSRWGSDEIHFHDFMTHPLGCGWHIDRMIFEKQLLQRAVEVGVTVHERTGVADATHADDGWNVRFDHTDNAGKRLGDSHFDVIIDATGRTSWFARRQGIDRLVENEQLALVTFLETEVPIEDSTSLVELTSDGWWYSAAIPGSRLATAFFCQPDKEQRRRWSQENGWSELLSGAQHTQYRVRSGGKTEMIGFPKFVAADSGILEQLYGPSWLAVGDAAMTFDPIASHGLMMAMVSARDAAHAISRFFSGEEAALSDYHALMWTAFQHYVQERRELLP